MNRNARGAVSLMAMVTGRQCIRRRLTDGQILLQFYYGKEGFKDGLFPTVAAALAQLRRWERLHHKRDLDLARVMLIDIERAELQPH